MQGPSTALVACPFAFEDERRHCPLTAGASTVQIFTSSPPSLRLGSSPPPAVLRRFCHDCTDGILNPNDRYASESAPIAQWADATQYLTRCRNRRKMLDVVPVEPDFPPLEFQRPDDFALTHTRDMMARILAFVSLSHRIRRSFVSRQLSCVFSRSQEDLFDICQFVSAVEPPNILPALQIALDLSASMGALLQAVLQQSARYCRILATGGLQGRRSER